MCTKSFFRRFGAFVAALVLCFALSVPALADDVSTSSFTFTFSSSTSAFAQSIQSGESSLIVPFSSASEGISLGYLVLPPDSVSMTGSIGVYLSFFYFSSSTGARQNKVPVSSDFNFYGFDLGGTVHSGSVSLKLFEPLFSLCCSR